MASHRAAQCLAQIQREAVNRISHTSRISSSRPIIPSSYGCVLNYSQKRFLSETRRCLNDSSAPGKANPAEQPSSTPDSSPTTSPKSPDIFSDFNFTQPPPRAASPAWAASRPSEPRFTSVAEGLAARARTADANPLAADFDALRRTGPGPASSLFPFSADALAARPDRVPRTDPTVGRSVKVHRGSNQLKGDVAYALRSLDAVLAKNRVRADLNRQRFHERPGLRRKRLASQNWRRRFAAQFKGMVGRVKELRKQGW